MLALFSKIIVCKLNLTEHLFLETTFTRARQGRKCESESRNCKVKPYFLKRAEILFALESLDLLIWLVREPLGLGEKIEIQSLESQGFFVCVLKSKMDYESKEYTLQRNLSHQSYDMCSQLSISKCIMVSDKSLLLIKVEIASGYYCVMIL